MITMSNKWASKLATEPETGMGDQVASKALLLKTAELSIKL